MIDPLSAGILLLLFLGRGKNTPSPRPLGTTTPGSLLPGGGGGPALRDAWRKRVTELLARTKGGDRWILRMTRLLGSDAAGHAAGRWIGIESSGNPLANSKLNERGLVQAMQISAKELGITAAEWDAMANPSTTDDQHALIAAKIIAAELAVTARAGYKCPDPGWGPAIAPSWGNLKSVNGIGIAKLRHGLPLLARELNDQKLLKPSIAETLMSGAALKPSDRLARYATGAHELTKIPADNLLIRFLASAAVVALGPAALTLADDRAVS